MSACSASRCELTDTYSPAAIDRAPATRPAMPAVITALVDAPEAATPNTRLAVETMPSLAPRTAARNQPMRSARCCSRWGMDIVLPLLEPVSGKVYVVDFLVGPRRSGLGRRCLGHPPPFPYLRPG